jgi:RND family efflux transporter MFP subunit
VKRTLIAMLAAATLACGCQHGDEPPTEQTLVAPVAMVPVTLHRFIETVEGSGTIAALPEAVILITPLYPGRVVSLPVQVGARVRGGDPVCEIVLDPVAAAEIEKLERVVTQADRALDRERNAFAAGVSPRVALEQAEVEAANAHAELRARTRDYVAATQRQTLRAPAAGLVTAVGARVGQQVDASTAVVTLVDPARLAAEVRFDAAVATRIAVGQAATVTPLNAGTPPLRAVVLRAAPLLDQTSQRAEAWLQCGADLPPGAFVRAAVEVGARESAAVPRSALVKTDHGYRVFVVADGAAHARDVRVGTLDEELAEIREGVAPGENIASAGAQELADGVRVTVGNEAP